MNENPEGTPNPLNPNPAPVGTSPAPEPVAPAPEPASEPTPTSEPAPASEPAPVSEPAPAVEPIATEPTMAPDNAPGLASTTEPAPDAMASAPSAPEAMPTSEPAPEMTSVSEPIPAEPTMTSNQGDITIPPAKKSKKGLIVLLVLFAALAIGCGVAALMIFNPFAHADKVPAAIEKVLKNGVPKNLGVNGTISVINASDESTLSDLVITLDSQFAFADKINKAKAGVSATFKDDTSLEFDVEEMSNQDGDMFIKLSGVADAYDSLQSGLTTGPLTDTSCMTSETGETDCVTVQNVVDVCEGDACATIENNSTSELGYIGIVARMLKTLDEEWIRIPATSVDDTDTTSVFNNPTQCISDAMAKLPSYGDNLVNAYKQNPFLKYSTENISVPALKDTIYRLTIDEAKLTGFINATDGNEFANALLACTGGTATNDGIEETEVSEIFANYPTIYVEIDDNFNFTRVILDADTNDLTAKVDFRLSYPETVTVTEPSEYLELNQAMEAIMKDLYGITEITTDDTTVVVEPTNE